VYIDIYAFLDMYMFLCIYTYIYILYMHKHTLIHAYTYKFEYIQISKYTSVYAPYFYVQLCTEAGLEVLFTGLGQHIKVSLQFLIT
jgi:hypothetical protein